MPKHSPDSPQDIDVTLLESVVITALEACDRHAHEFARIAAAAREYERSSRRGEDSPGLVTVIKAAADSAEASARRSLALIRHL